jgi:hypothetical protein
VRDDVQNREERQWTDERLWVDRTTDGGGFVTRLDELALEKSMDGDELHVATRDVTLYSFLT